ncbi:MAG TPA: metal-dependent hydrolase [Candidatus Thermoplasmatota archaeon]|nr:metal-dependent hydrolase [Candidatus Thermoplasmatota archaeon]
MDTLTHLLIGYLLGASLFGDPALVTLVTVMAVLPDIDTVSWFAPRLIPSLRHRGQTHSLALGIPLALAAGLLTWLLAGTPLWATLAASFIGWASHLVLDVLNWGCAVMWPWSPERVHYTIQWGLRGPMIASAAGISVLLLIAEGAPRQLGLAVTVIGLGWLVYLALKLAIRVYLGRRNGEAAAVTPTGHPLVWTVWDALPTATSVERLSPADGRVIRLFSRRRS